MDYFAVLKRAASITWRYKMLWVLGLFAGTMSSGSSNFRSSLQNRSNGSGVSTDPFTQWISQHPLNFAIIVGVLLFVGLALFVVSLAAQGGLIHGANEAAENRTPRLGSCWNVGIGKMGRTFMIGLVTGLPGIVLASLMVLLIVGLGLGGYLVGDSRGLAGGAIVGLCVVLPIFVLLLIVVSVVIGVVYPLALRYGVLQDVTFGQAIRRGWDDLREKRGAFVFWLVMLLPGLAATVVLGLIMVPFFIPAVLLIVAKRWVIGIALAVLGWLVLLTPMAIYSTFVSVAWTIFFRGMKGMELGVQLPPRYAAPAADPQPQVPYAPPPRDWAAPAPPMPGPPPAATAPGQSDAGGE